MLSTLLDTYLWPEGLTRSKYKLGVGPWQPWEDAEGAEGAAPMVARLWPCLLPVLVLVPHPVGHVASTFAVYQGGFLHCDFR